MNIAKEIKTKPTVMPHAKKRAKQRFGMSSVEFSDWVNDNFRKFKYVGITYGNGGNPSRLFTYEGRGIIFDLKESVVITTYYPDEYEPINRKLSRFATQELAIAERNETKQLRNIERLRAEIEIEIGELRLRLLSTRSLPKKLAIQGRMKALEMRLAELPSEEYAVKREKVRKAIALARVM